MSSVKDWDDTKNAYWAEIDEAEARKPGRPHKNPSDCKTERVNFFISKAELEAIDEWGWGNHIRSRSEVIRRLCQLGMETGRVKTAAEHAAVNLKIVES